MSSAFGSDVERTRSFRQKSVHYHTPHCHADHAPKLSASTSTRTKALVWHPRSRKGGSRQKSKMPGVMIAPTYTCQAALTPGRIGGKDHRAGICLIQWPPLKFPSGNAALIGSEPREDKNMPLEAVHIELCEHYTIRSSWP